jgi:hypothetical protein
MTNDQLGFGDLAERFDALADDLQECREPRKRMVMAKKKWPNS